MNRIKKHCVYFTEDSTCILKLKDKTNTNKKCTFTKCKDYRSFEEEYKRMREVS